MDGHGSASAATVAEEAVAEGETELAATDPDGAAHRNQLGAHIDGGHTAQRGVQKGGEWWSNERSRA